MMNNKHTLLLLLLFAFSSLHAQSGRLFTTDTELSNSLINNIFQDKNGIIWIATEDGLNRYDGSKFTIYKHDEQAPQSLLNNYIRQIFEDDKGNLFIGFFNGLQQYDYTTDTFTTISMIQGNETVFGSHVTTMLQRRNGEILVGTSGHGLFQLKPGENGFYAQQVILLSPSNSIIHLFEDKDENLWMSTNDKGLFCFNRENEIKNYFGSASASKNIISSLCQDKEGNIYASSQSTGLYLFHASTNSFLPIPYLGKPSLSIKTLYLNNKNEILIGTDGSGMKIYTPGSGKIKDENFNVSTFDFSKAKIHSIMEDKSGNIWLGIFQKGVMLLSNSSNKFKYIGYKSITNNSIGSNCIMSLCKDSEGTIWVGTDSDGIYGIYPNGTPKIHFAHTGQATTVPATIMCIYEDSNQDLWIGSYQSGLAKLNRKTGTCEYVQGLLDENSYPVQTVYSLVEDKDKNLWIGTMGTGLYCMNLNTKEITQYSYTDNKNQGRIVHNWWINHLLKTHDDKLYIGTYDGLSYMNLDTKTQNYSYSNRLLPRDVIYTLYEDRQGDIWVGTSHGLMYLNNKTNETRFFTMKDGLPSNVICAIAGDQTGCLWISTNYGISRLNPKDYSFLNYYSSDGLQGNEFSKNAVITTLNDEIMFGGINGISYFNPEDITNEKRELKIHITDFYIHDQPVKKGMKSGPYDIIDTSVLNAKRFHLSYKDNSFSIEFSTMEFHNPERITYKYSINNDGWTSLQPGTNRVTFSNLAPGEYSFKVKAEDYNNSSPIKEITVIISPAWYASGWAKFIYCLIAALVIYLIISQIRLRYRARQRLLEHIHAKEINEAKLQFFINISHEIRTPMSLIISPLKKLIATDEDREHQKAYSIIHRNAERILQLINQLMDIRKIDKGQMRLKFQETDMVELIQDTCSIFEDQMKLRHLEYRLHHDMKELKAWIDPKNFDKILFNVLSNAIKFTPEHGRIDVYIQYTNDPTDLRHYFEIIVSDNGIGIDEGEIERIFERFYQATNSQSSTHEGTGVGLHLTRSIIELHHGTIKAENNKDGEGCRFIIRLPLGKDHLKPEEIDTNPISGRKPAYSFQPLPATPDTDGDIKVKSKSKRYVLVVDDDKEIREYICRELASEYHTIECSNGKEALASILEKAPDLIISDIVMPEMDGITLCRKIRQNVTINHIPIILLTAKTKEEDNLEGLDIGADAYLTKPFNIEIVRKTAQNMIRNREMLRNNFSGNQQQKDKVKKITIKSADDKLMEKIMKTINENISNPNLNVEMIASQTGISRVHLHRKLKELTNQSTRDLVRNIRLQQAANLLSSKYLSVSEVAAATGFINLAHFSNSFKEVYGMSPMAYMDAHLKKTEDTENL